MTVYLDHNATTPVRPEAASAVAYALSEAGNPSSVHGAGRAARRLIEDAREKVAALVGAQAENVIFTSGGTEANNLALANASVDPASMFVSAVEHASVLDAASEAIRIPVDSDGVINLAALEELLSRSAKSDGTGFVSIMLANNETGVIQPIHEAAKIARRHGARIHCDAVQAAGKVAVSLPDLGVHMMSLSAHKIGGPAGVGALVVAPGTKIRSILQGGGQERSRRAGTENVAGIAGFGEAADRAVVDLGHMATLAELRDAMEADIAGAAPDAKFFAHGRERLPTTSCLTMPGVSAETQVMAFDLAGIAVSAGAACSSGKVEPSHVLKAMGVDGDDLMSALRVSLGWTTGKTDIDEFVRTWKSLYARLGQASLAA